MPSSRHDLELLLAIPSISPPPLRSRSRPSSCRRTRRCRNCSQTPGPSMSRLWSGPIPHQRSPVRFRRLKQRRRLSRPEFFQTDGKVIADTGTVRPGVQTLTVALRGTAIATLEVTTLRGLKQRSLRRRGSRCPDPAVACAGFTALRARRRDGDQALRREDGLVTPTATPSFARWPRSSTTCRCRPPVAEAHFSVRSRRADRHATEALDHP